MSQHNQVKRETKNLKIPEFLILGMLPWNYSQLSDTVRSMVHTLEPASYIFLNPQADYRSFSWHWKIRNEGGGSEIWDPPLNFLPTRYGGYRIREILSAYSLQTQISERLGEHWRDHTIFYVTASTLEQSYEYVMKLKPKRLVFDILDDNLGFPAISATKRKCLKKKFLAIAKQAEVVTAVSEYLVSQTEEWIGRNVMYLPNGVDIQYFSPQNKIIEPEDMKQISHPRLVFVGAITSWIDSKLLMQVAKNYSQYQLVLIGPVFETSAELESLKNMTNVHILGAKPFEEISHYMHAADVLLLPRTSDPHSLACDPLKLYEYLATGKPVVSTAHPSVQRFSDVVYIGSDAKSFIEAIPHALGRSIEQKNRQLLKVGDLSWEARVHKLKEILKMHDTYRSIPVQIRKKRHLNPQKSLF